MMFQWTNVTFEEDCTMQILGREMLIPPGLWNGDDVNGFTRVPPGGGPLERWIFNARDGLRREVVN